MSFKNANQQVMRFVLNYGNTGRTYETIRAFVDARRFNNTITERDLGVEGKLREFQMTYIPIQCNADGDCNDNVCSPGVIVEPAQALFNPKQCTASPVYKIKADDLREVDGDYTFSDHALGIINAAMPAIRRNLAMQMASLLVANAGVFPDGHATHRITMANQTNGSINPVGQWEIERVFADNGFGAPTIIGSGEVYTWQQSQRIAGLNAAGMNLARMGGVNIYYDALIAQVVGDGQDHIFAFDPQVLKFITWSRNAGMFATDPVSLAGLETMFKRGSNQRLRGVLRDPITGITWDLDLLFDPASGSDDCDGIWKMQLKLIWDIFFLPDIACNAQGVNGIFHFTTCPRVDAPCPTGDAHPAPVAPKVFGWDPGFAYPLYIGTAKIGDTTTKPEVSVTNDADVVALMNDSGGGMHFTIAAGVIQYTGYTAITGNFNGNINIAFV